MIEVEINQRLGDFQLDVGFSGDGGVTALFGPSGSGKSSVIKIIAGLTRLASGRVVVDGTVLADGKGRHVPPYRRRIGVVFQEARLFPHLSVRNNLRYGRLFTPRDQRRVAEEPVIETLGIGHLLDRRPATLSGGEQQRVALGRAMLASPRLLLMDEPLASLDVARRLEILPLIEALRDEFGIPIVYVSHAVEEVARLAGKIVVLEAGRVARQGSPADVFRIAADRFAIMSVVEGRLGAPDDAFHLTPIETPAGIVWLNGLVRPLGRAVRVLVHATDVALATRRPEGVTIRTVLAGTVADIPDGSGPSVTVDVALQGGTRLAASVTRAAVAELGLEPGRQVFALVKSVALDERPL
ncbi:molybdenum ABC transporter ATP-binding protein [Pleomorphomonas diazotrophica]|uniref:Molybdenum ABC transporter ATP-binding protein n=1 Tax=Pleomorphomonas diazotrophica TaxID=1166257 RepID=A0A1I4TAH0_9HYPH|nr:molybdenum ABC transporter ATP-binding protein [Pleomorphomonas diazotrophica]PKR89449.1 molybdenum ABC transporter ATP-binding protein [Pleomorphomonas diazotrophica]SFM73788.1 molybdate transport system ATP-binding protein [Pleomorphomonas diazotrophica]